MACSLRLIVLCALFAGALAAAGCGANSETGIQQAATDEGQYLEVGGLKYQVQISRQLNPSDNEDRGYLVGVPSGEQQREQADGTHEAQESTT